MERSTRRLSKLILWEIVILFVLIMLFTYAPVFIEMESISEVIPQFLSPLIMILFVLIVTKLFLTLLQPVFKKAITRYLPSSYEVKQTWQFISYLIWIGSFIVLSFLLLGDITSIGIFLVLLIIIIVLISHKAIVNFAGWLLILFSSSVKRGDLIEIDGIRGKISEVSTMHTVLEEKSSSLKEQGYTGRKVTIPNSLFFSRPMFSITSDESVIWDEIRILLPEKEDHLLAEDIMTQVSKTVVGPIMKKRRQDMMNKVSSPDEIPEIPMTSISLEENGVLITLRFFCSVVERSEVRSAISEGILKEFNKEKIEIKFR